MSIVGNIWNSIKWAVKITKFYVIWCSSYDTLSQLQYVPFLQLFIGNFFFAANYVAITHKINSFVFITTAQVVCWCLSLLDMPMEMSIFTTVLLTFSESYRYYHFMIVTTYWSKIVITYFIGSDELSGIHYFFSFIATIAGSFVMLPIVSDINNISLYVCMGYYAQYVFTGTYQFAERLFGSDYDSDTVNPIVQNILLCLILTYPYKFMRIPNFTSRYF